MHLTHMPTAHLATSLRTTAMLMKLSSGTLKAGNDPNHCTPILSHFDHYNKFLFTLITKNYITDHPSYYALSMALHNLKNLLWEYQILDIIIPKPERN